MPRLLIVTYVDFWRNGAGHRMRISSLVRYLKDKVTISVVFAGFFDRHDRQILLSLYPEVQVDVLEENGNITYKGYRDRFEAYIAGKVFDFVLVEFIELSLVLPLLDSRSITMLDTHDILSDRIESFRRNNLFYSGMKLTADEEFEIFDCFDYVIAIHATDFIKINKKVTEDRILLVPHPVTFAKKELDTTVKVIGFVASEYYPNITAIVWFLANVWPLLSQYGLTLNIYGNVCRKLNEEWIREIPNANLCGFVDDLGAAYECDIMVNPVKCGAGLKIKNVEALGNGLPLVTTSHGSTGMEDGSNVAFLVADTPQEFAYWIEKLVVDFDFRQQVASNAYDYAQRCFKAEQCYKPLLDVMLAI